MSDLSIALLGPPRVEFEGERLDVDGRKPLALLAYLAVCGPQSRETLAALLWPHSDHDRARGALRKALSLLNTVLGDRCLQRSRGEVGLDDERVWTDVGAFRDAMGRAGAHDHPAAATCAACLGELAPATELYRDDFLAGFGLRDSEAFDDWQRQSADELRHELTVALDRLVEAHTHRGELEVALTYANRRLAVEPLHEPTHRRLVLLHAWSGRRAEAVRQYERCAQLLERELGVAPMRETVAAYEAVLAGRAGPPPAATRAVETRPPVPQSGSSLVGRADEIRRVIDAHATAASGGRLLTVEGEAGAGKSALLNEVTTLLRDRGAATVTVRGREAERTLPYGVVADAIRQVATDPGPGLAAVAPAWVAEAARLAPELLEAHPRVEPAPSVDAPETRRRLLEGIRRVLLDGVGGPVPGLVLIDDAQWLDEASLDAVLYLADRLTGPACLLVLAWRSEAVPADHRLRRLTADLAARGQADQLQLHNLGHDDVASLVAAEDREDPDGTITQRLLQETQGLPLLVVECLRALPPGAVDPAAWPIPTGARGLLRARIDDLSQSARQVACTAAVIGRSFGLDVLVPASGMTELDTITALDELLEAGILDEEVGAAAGAPPTYDFRFHALRALVYEDASLARRRLLHGHVADALTGVGHASAPAALAVVAEHLRLAGRDLEAAETFVRAAETAQRVAALDEAAAHLRSAIELGHPQPAQLQEQLGGLEKLRGDYPAALRALRSAALGLDEPGDQVRIELAIAQIHERRGAWHTAMRHLERGLDWVQQAADSEPLAARLHAELAVTAHRQGDPVAAHRRGEEALELAERSQDAWARALAHNTLGMVARASGSLDEAAEHLERAQLLAEELEDPSAAVSALNNLALTYADRGERSRALELAKTALARCRRRGDRHHEAALLNNLADLLHAAGHHEEAQQHLAEAVTLFADVGQPDQLEPEIWKLVDW